MNTENGVAVVANEATPATKKQEKKKAEINLSGIESALVQGDLSKLNEEQRLNYYKSVCDSVGLNTLTKPFEYIVLNGKMVLYATKSCTEQLRKIHNISLKITDKKEMQGVYIVTVLAQQNGRFDESTGAVNIANLKGDALANALMKAETKAKRRATLSICGLGMLDETEVETINVSQVQAPSPALSHPTFTAEQYATIAELHTSGMVKEFVEANTVSLSGRQLDELRKLYKTKKAAEQKKVDAQKAISEATQQTIIEESEINYNYFDLEAKAENGE